MFPENLGLAERQHPPPFAVGFPHVHGHVNDRADVRQHANGGAGIDALAEDLTRPHIDHVFLTLAETLATAA